LGFISSKKLPKTLSWGWDFLDGALMGAGSLKPFITLFFTSAQGCCAFYQPRQPEQ